MNGEPVVRIRATTVTDRGNNARADWDNATRTTIEHCAVAPRRPDTVPDAARQGVIVGLTIYAPAGTDVVPSDRLEVRGETYEIDGDLADWRNPHSGRRPGVEINAKKVDG